MSSKAQSTSKDTKIPSKEVMVTRHKSAQMKRQLRTKDRSMKHITDLLKSPTKDTSAKTVPVKKKPSPKAKQSLLQSVQKIQNLPQKTFKLSKVLRKEVLLVQDEEYYPNKRKRKLNVNKVILKAKPNMKVVGEITGSVKRKYAVPVKASDNPVPLQPVPDSAKQLKECAKLSMAEAIQLMDEHLTDEDLMEILTCPSPVWWEDPPDEDYTEEPLFTRSPPATEKKDDRLATPAPMEVDAEVSETSTGKIIPISNLSAKSDKFLKKRSKLENLLDNIKDKNNKEKVNNSNEEIIVPSSNYNDENKKDLTEKMSNTIEQDVIDNQIKDNVVKNEIEDDAGNEYEEDFLNNETEKDVANDDGKKDESHKEQTETKLSESDDEIILHNSSMNEDELLKDLENMEIPVANVIVIDDDDDFLEKSSENTVREDSKKGNTEVKSHININTDSIKVTDKSDSNEVPKNLPVLQKCHLSDDVASPKSFDCTSPKSSQSSVVSSNKDIDSISDTNIRFLIEDEEDKIKISQGNLDNALNKCNESESIDTDKSTENVTIYKIIEEISDAADTNILNIVDSKLNDYYKKCKKVYQKKKTDINKNEMENGDTDSYSTVSCDNCKPTFKKVSETEDVKYCLKCSAIFDSKDCTYCINKLNRACKSCKIKFCCLSYYENHAESCKKTINRHAVVE